MRAILVENPFDTSQTDVKEAQYTGESVLQLFAKFWPEKDWMDFRVYCNGGDSDFAYVPNEEDELIFCLNVEGGDNSSLFAILGSAIAIIGTAGLAIPAIGMTATVAYAMIGIGSFISALGGFFSPKPTSQSFDSSQTYSWDGVQNIIGEGNPVPVVYGKHRVGGIVIEGYVDGKVENGVSEDNFLYMVTALSEGVVDEIFLDTVKINDKYAWLYYDGETSEDKFWNAKLGIWETVAGVISDSRNYIIRESRLRSIYAGGDADNSGPKDPGGYEAHVPDGPHDGY